MRHLLCGRCRLGGFARSFVHLYHATDTCRQTSHCSNLFPIPLPYPEAVKENQGPVKDHALKSSVNAVIVVLNFLHFNKPRSAVGLLQHRNLNREQWAAVKRMGEFVLAWTEVSPIGPEEMGRTAAKVESLESNIAALEKEAENVARSCHSYFGRSFDAVQTQIPGRMLGKVVGQSCREPLSTFKPIEPHRLSFMGRPSFDPTPYLDKAGKAIYNDPLSTRLDLSEAPAKPPQLRVHCSREERVKLYELLDSSGRLSLHPPSRVTPSFGSGLFAVTKDLQKERMILDSRGANILESPPQRWIKSLSAGDLLTHLVLHDDEILTVSGNDLRDFYYLFTASESRQRRNVLSAPVSIFEVQHLHCCKENLRHHKTLYPSLATLAMGDTQAVELAQTAHVGLAYQHGIICSNNLISLTRPLPRGDVLTGIVIDDFLAISKIRQELGPGGLSPAASLADQMQQTYKDVGLIPHETKAFRDQAKSSFWGVDLDGQRGHLRGSLKRAVPLAGLILRTVKAGVATGELLQTIAGSLISLLLFRRRLMALLDTLFDSYRNRHPTDIIALSGHVKGDLLSIVVLLPLAATNLRAKVQGRITACDASGWGEAGVVSKIPNRIAEELVRHSLRKSVWCRLLTPAAAVDRLHGRLDPSLELPDATDEFRCNALWDLLARGLSYRLLYKQRSRSHRHINIGEVRALLHAESLHGRSNPSSRELYGLDSQVALGCLLKGRASSPAINAELVKSLPSMLCYDTYFYGMYFSTKSNPSDDPTRGAEVREAELDLPDWWEDAAEGKFKKFDSWMEEQQLDESSVSGLPALNELGKCKVSPSGILPPGQTDSICSVAPEAEVRDPENTPAGSPKYPPSKSNLMTQKSDASTASAVQFDFPEITPEVSSLLAAFPKSQFIGLECWPPKKQGYLDLFSGARGVAKDFARMSGTWSLCFDLEHDVREDLDRPELRKSLEALIRKKAFAGVGMAPVCASFSTAITPPVRSKLHPLGVPNLSSKMQSKIDAGNSMAIWCFSLLDLCLTQGVPCWLENPAMSWMFRIPMWFELEAKHKNLRSWVVDYCRYGTKWRKRAKIWSSTCLGGFKTLCAGCLQHQLLRGRSSLHRMNWTRVAQAYPKGVSRCIAKAVLQSCFPNQIRAFDPAMCAKVGTLRVGEAKNPGPAPRTGLLSEVPLVETRTLQLQGKIWCEFERWCLTHLSAEAFESIKGCPLLFIKLAKEYGDFLYSKGSAIYVYRHFVALIQKSMLEVRPYISELWDMVTRWESLQPCVHRIPLPAAIFRAMVSVAMSWQWFRFAAALGIAFYGIGRPGEVLAGKRRDLVLPSDMLHDTP